MMDHILGRTKRCKTVRSNQTVLLYVVLFLVSLADIEVHQLLNKMPEAPGINFHKVLSKSELVGPSCEPPKQKHLTAKRVLQINNMCSCVSFNASAMFAH